MMNDTDLRKPRRGLSADALIETLRLRFQDVPDHRASVMHILDVRYAHECLRYVCHQRAVDALF